MTTKKAEAAFERKRKSVHIIAGNNYKQVRNNYYKASFVITVLGLIIMFAWEAWK